MNSVNASKPKDSLTIQVEKEPYDEGIAFYTHDKVTFYPGIAVLVGCNGSGKTTLFHQIDEQLDPLDRKKKDPDLLYMKYDNLREGASHGIDSACFAGNMDLVAQMVLSSEGENIRTNVGEFGARIGVQISRNPKAKRVVICMDACDSGFSIDNILDLKDFFHFIEEQNPEKFVYFIISANSYEMANGEDCVEINTLKHCTFSSYDGYRSYILKTRNIKEKRYDKKVKPKRTKRHPLPKTKE